MFDTIGEPPGVARAPFFKGTGGLNSNETMVDRVALSVLARHDQQKQTVFKHSESVLQELFNFISYRYFEWSPPPALKNYARAMIITEVKKTQHQHVFPCQYYVISSCPVLLSSVIACTFSSCVPQIHVIPYGPQESL